MTGRERSPTPNLGLRWDLMTGYQFDESKNRNYVAVVEAAKAGLLTGIKGPRTWPEPAGGPQQLPAAHRRRFRSSGTGSDVIRAGWGIYTDVGYTNSNGLLAAGPVGQRVWAGVQRVTLPAFATRRQLLSGRPATRQHREPEPGRSHRRVPALRPVGRSPAAGAAAYTADNVGWSHELTSHGDHRRLRARGRPRPKLPSAREPAAHGHDHPPARRPRAVARPEHCRHQADHQPGQEPA